MGNIAFKPYILRKKDYAGSVHVDNGDKTILKVYKKVLKTTMVGALHYLLGLGARCYEEKHDEEIQNLQKRVRFQAKIIVKYIEKYGQLRAKD